MLGSHKMEENTQRLNGASFGERVTAARREKNMTQQDLSKRIGVSRAAVGNWEVDATSPSITKIEEVAKVLGVSPEWLAYNVQPGNTVIKYRNPERDNIVWVDEVSFGESPDELETGDKWGIPSEYLIRNLHSNSEATIICTVNSHAVEPEYEYDDKVFVDTSDKRPSPAGVFVYWDGIGMAFARMQAIPGVEPKVRITQRGADQVDMPLSEVTVIGRVKGRLQRA